MPLHIPGITGHSKGSVDNRTRDWQDVLLGKKLGDKTDETTFDKSKLPQGHRILKKDEVTTADHDPERINIHLDENELVRDVSHG